MHLIKPMVVLETCMLVDDAVLYLNIYRCLEEHGVIPPSHLDMHTMAAFDKKMPKYVSVLREMWSNRLEMEPI